ncbi:MAG TPA: hypothetical protein VE377_21920 [Candidatus Dormibacteraeota bacterium]|nr:hypothetical protein [Candidatus Dormibacteraeota bacterium]
MLRATSLVFVLLASLGAVRSSWAQDPHIHLPPAVAQAQDLHTPIPPSTVPGPGTGDTSIPAGDDIQRQQWIAANEQRQLEIRRDTRKIAELTEELKEYLEKAERGVISVDAIKKAEQIEKLAHSVKSKMKQSF